VPAGSVLSDKDIRATNWLGDAVMSLPAIRAIRQVFPHAHVAVLARPSAMAEFERLFSSGNIPGKCYALVGIRKLNPQRFKELAQSLRSSKEPVETMRGCIIFHEPFGAVIKQIDAGKYSR